MERVVLDHECQVDCWVERCDKTNSCFDCPELGADGLARKRPLGLITEADYFEVRGASSSIGRL